MRRVLAWLRWEMSRRVALTTGVKLIVLDRGVKAVVLTIAGIALIVTERTGLLVSITDRIHQELNLAPGSHLWLRLTDDVLQHLGRLSNRAQIALGIALLAYAALETVEAIGLIARRRWAEYLVLLATVAFIPLEIDELLRHPTVFKGLALLVNVAIAVYLVIRKRLFLGGPPDEPEVATPAPAPIGAGRS